MSRSVQSRVHLGLVLLLVSALQAVSCAPPPGEPASVGTAPSALPNSSAATSSVSSAPDISFINGTWCGPGELGVTLTGTFRVRAGRSFTGTLLTGFSCGDASIDTCESNGEILPSGTGQLVAKCLVSGVCKSTAQMDAAQTTITGTVTCTKYEDPSIRKAYTLVKQ